jgi:hypothetical protein
MPEYASTMDAPANRRSFFCHFLAGSFCFSASVSSASSPPSQPIPWNQLGFQATAQYSGDGLGVIATPRGAQLRCVLQKLEGEVTAEGLSLNSTIPGVRDQLHVTASRIGRDGGQTLVLDKQGAVQILDAHARYVRPAVIEEYSVAADGIRQDFLVTQSPAGPGPLRLQLTLRGARAEVSPDGAQLVLNESGRKLNYNRLRVTDATGRQLAAWMQVAAESRDFQNQLKPATAPPSPPGRGIEGEGQTGTSRSLAAEGEGQTSSSLTLVVEDAGALYPLRIDPTFSDANWISMGGIAANGPVYAAVVDSGNLYIGGSFTVAGNVLATNIAKWNGTNWSALGSGMSGGFALKFFPTVYALVMSGSDLYAGGLFATAGGSPANSIAKWNGSSWSALGLGIDSSPPPTVFALAMSGTDLYAGGSFRTAGGSPATNIAKWNGSTWSALGSGVNGGVRALAVSGNDLYAGGWFTTAGGSPASSIAKWNGSTWSALGSGMSDGSSYPTVYALAVSGSELYAGGSFTTAGGGPAVNVAKWNGSTWSPLGSGTGGAPSSDSTVRALAVSGSDLYTGARSRRRAGTRPIGSPSGMGTLGALSARG